MNREVKYCPRCKKFLLRDSFYKSNQTKDGLYGYCKSCSKTIRTKEDKRSYNRKYYKTESGQKSYKKYIQSDKKKIVDKKYYQTEKGKICIKRQSVKYISSGKCAEYYRVRYKQDIKFRLKRLLRSRMNLALTNNQKSGHSLELLGCSIDELKVHLEQQFEPGMTWNNYGEWHIDHIIPCNYFDLTKEENQRICFNYRNLQPLWAEENNKKHDLVPENVEELVQFLKQEIF